MSNREDRQLTEGWDPTYTGNQTYEGPFPAVPDITDVPCTDWVRQQILNNKAKGEGIPMPLGPKMPPSVLPKLATMEYVDQQMDSIRDCITEEIAKEKASFYRFLLRQAVCFIVGMAIGWLATGWLWDSIA